MMKATKRVLPAAPWYRDSPFAVAIKSDISVA
jgi:hypothetical protein